MADKNTADKKTESPALVKISIALVVAGLLIGWVTTGIRHMVEGGRVAHAKVELEAIRDAIIGYALTHGRLPCPAKARCEDGRLTTNGVAQHEGERSCGSDLWGFVPHATLGLEPHDIWGNYRVYRISEDFGRPITENSMGNITIVDSHAGGEVVADNIAAVLFSLGPNEGFGHAGTEDAYTPPRDRGRSRDEAENFINDCSALTSEKVQDNVFVYKNPVPSGVEEDEFDDVMTWISPYMIIARMIPDRTGTR